MKAIVELENFTSSEMDGLSDKLKLHLQMIRYIAGVPIHITSGLRTGDTDSEHSLGAGADISDNDRGEEISSLWRHKVLSAAYLLGLRRIGVYDRHIHIGVATSYPQDVTWWGVSD